MLTIRIDNETKQLRSYLSDHKVRYQQRIRAVIKAELKLIACDFKLKEKRIKNAPDWLYD